MINEDRTIITILCNLPDDSIDIENITDCEQIKELICIVERKMQELSNLNNTAKLWINCIRMVSIFKDFIAAERMGKWKEHLHCVEIMLPYFHAAGHLPYAKACLLYTSRCV